MQEQPRLLLRLVSKMLDDIRFEQSVRNDLNSNKEPDISFRLDPRYESVRGRIEQEHSLEPITVAVMEPPAGTEFESRAVPLIQRNVPVIPLKPRTKIAFLKSWENKATTDRAHIEHWAKEYPDANVASVAKREPGGIWIFEVDKENFHEQVEQQTGQRIPDTFIVRSSPGRGHFYFRQTTASIAMGNRQGKDADGKEAWSARVDNRYVVGPGSIHPNGGMYEVLKDAAIVDAPQWLIDFCVANDAKTEKASHAELDKEDPIAQGARNETITSILGKARQQNSLQYDALLALARQHNQRCVPPLPDSELKTIAGSIAKYSVKESGAIVFPEPQKPATTDLRPMETEPINLVESSVKSLDYLPSTVLASTRLQDIFMDFSEHDWPLTLALPALVTAASVVVPPMPRTEGLVIGDDSMVNLYTALIADVNAGKSQVANWAATAIGIYDPPFGQHYFEGKWGST